MRSMVEGGSETEPPNLRAPSTIRLRRTVPLPVPGRILGSRPPRNLYTPFMRLTRREALALAALAIPGIAAAQRELDLEVPYVPTPPELVERMLELAPVRAGDYLIDLGCGDGRIAIAAARRGARALGVDIDPDRIAEAVAASSIRAGSMSTPSAWAPRRAAAIAIRPSPQPRSIR
jgi:SAM-dependent methyltransferase